MLIVNHVLVVVFINSYKIVCWILILHQKLKFSSQIFVLKAAKFDISGLHERRLHEDHPRQQTPPPILRRKLRLLHADPTWAARESGQAIQMGAGSDFTHEGTVVAFPGLETFILKKKYFFTLWNSSRISKLVPVGTTSLRGSYGNFAFRNNFGWQETNI